MKGIAWQAVLPLVLLVIAFAVIGPKLLEASTKSSSLFCGLLGNCNRLAGLEVGDNLEKAIRCSDARCFKGCSKINEGDITWNDKAADCKRDFCKDIAGNKIDGKICDDDARANPVIFRPTDKVGAIIQADDNNFKDVIACMVPTPTEKCGSGGFTKEVMSTGTERVLYLDASLIKGGEATGGGIIHRTCIGRLELVKVAADAAILLPGVGIVGKSVEGVVKAGGVIAKLSAVKNAAVFSKVGGGVTAASVGGALFFTVSNQVQIMTTATLNPTSGPLYIWTNHAGFWRELGGRFLGLSFGGGTASHSVVCSTRPLDCRGTSDTCEDRAPSLCKPELGCEPVGDKCQAKILPKQPVVCKDLDDKSCNSHLDCSWSDGKCENAKQAKTCESFKDRESCIISIDCGWYKEENKELCEPIKGPVACQQLSAINDNGETCKKQPGCSWYQQREGVKRQEFSEQKLADRLNNGIINQEVKSFVDAINKVGGEEVAINLWGKDDILAIKDLFKNPSVVHLNKWSEFQSCGDVPHDFCSSTPPPETPEKKYCNKGKYDSYPDLCGCKKGSGVQVTLDKDGKIEMVGNGIGFTCVPFSDPSVVDPVNLVLRIDKYKSDNGEITKTINGKEVKFTEKVHADGKDFQEVYAILLDNKNIVVTGIDTGSVSFTATLGGKDIPLDTEPCIDDPKTTVTASGYSSGSGYSCSARITSKEPGTATVMFKYKKLDKGINVDFIATGESTTRT